MSPMSPSSALTSHLHHHQQTGLQTQSPPTIFASSLIVSANANNASSCSPTSLTTNVAHTVFSTQLQQPTVPAINFTPVVRGSEASRVIAATQIGFDRHFGQSPELMQLDKPTTSSSGGYNVHESLSAENREEPNCSPFTATAYLKNSDDLDDNYIKSDDMTNTFHLVPQAAVEIEMHEVCDNQEENYECITLLDLDEASEKSKSLNRRKAELKIEAEANAERVNPVSLMNPIASLERSELKVVDEHYVLCPSQSSQTDTDSAKKSNGDRKTCPICFKTITSKNYARHRRTHPGAQGSFARGGAPQYWLPETTTSSNTSSQNAA